jgi:SAM-dependent MidA family methyltransferase
VRAHHHVGPLETPGAADLTAHVDFAAAAREARAVGAEAWGPEPQGEWLGRLGLAARAEALARALPEGETLRNHLDAFRRLTDPARMGTLFKALAVTAAGAPPPPGFSGTAPPDAAAPAAGAATATDAKGR